MIKSQRDADIPDAMQQPADHWTACGFDVEHTPGVARAYVRFQSDGSQWIVTDLEGFDLPETDGPYQVMLLAADGEMLHGPEIVEDMDTLLSMVGRSPDAFV